MNLEVNYTLEEALDLGWKTLAECFKPEEVGIKQTMVDKFWPHKVAAGEEMETQRHRDTEKAR